MVNTNSEQANSDEVNDSLSKNISDNRSKEESEEESKEKSEENISSQKEMIDLDKKHKNYNFAKAQQLITFFFTTAIKSLVELAANITKGDPLETHKIAIESGIVLTEAAGFGGFIKRVRDNKTFKTISNSVESVFSKPVRNLLSIGSGVAAIIISGGTAAITSLATTLVFQSYSIYKDIKNYKKLNSNIKELGLLKKEMIVTSHKNEILESMSNVNPNIDLNRVVNKFHSSMIPFRDQSDLYQEIKGARKIPGSNLVLSALENSGVFASNISAGLAMTAIKTLGSTAFAEMKAEEIQEGLNDQLIDLKANLPYYNSLKNLCDQTNDQFILCNTLKELKHNKDFLEVKDEKIALNMLRDKFYSIKEITPNIVDLPKTPSNWEAFIDTQNSSSNYGNISHNNSISETDNSVALFKDEFLAKMKTNSNNINISNIQIVHDIKIDDQLNSKLINIEIGDQLNSKLIDIKIGDQLNSKLIDIKIGDQFSHDKNRSSIKL